MVSFPYYSHIFRDSYGSGMGIVWEAYHKGVPLLGVPENPIDNKLGFVFKVIFYGLYHDKSPSKTHHLGEYVWFTFSFCIKQENSRKPCKSWDKLPTLTGDRRV